MNGFVLFIMVFYSVLIHASPFEGTQKIYLVSSGDELTHIANIEFKTQDHNSTYELTIVDEAFENQFLSMRPFQCIMGKKQVMCHVPYPYKKKGFLTDTDLLDLSLDLLFLHKSPSEYGINLWNGIFYKLQRNGNKIDGVVHEVDLNTIAAPPEDPAIPFPDDEVFQVDLKNYVYPRILIQ